MPKNNPTVADNPTPTITDVQGSDIGTEVRLRTANATSHARTTPARPPAAESTDDSTRYWYRMSRRRAPSDLRMPISWVRSVTTANMMFMITTPPTTMNPETIPTAMPAMVAVSRSHRLTIVSEANRLKLSSCPGVRCRYDRNSTRTSSSDSIRCGWSVALAPTRHPNRRT